jgi:HPt (histidine-containing phosphotransfer) domain-containing protein
MSCTVLGMNRHLLGFGRLSVKVIFYFERIEWEARRRRPWKAEAMTADTIHITATEPGERVTERVTERAARHSAPPLSPGQPAVDLAHLARMTLGEKGLEREVLDLFERQADMLLARMAADDPRMVGAFAHTLAGSASGIGAWRVAEAATALERAAAVPGTGALAGLIDHLAAAVAEVHAAIRDMQHAS